MTVHMPRMIEMLLAGPKKEIVVEAEDNLRSQYLRSGLSEACSFKEFEVATRHLNGGICWQKLGQVLIIPVTEGEKV
jgi:hypothetical protein